MIKGNYNARQNGDFQKFYQTYRGFSAFVGYDTPKSMLKTASRNA